MAIDFIHYFCLHLNSTINATAAEITISTRKTIKLELSPVEVESLESAEELPESLEAATFFSHFAYSVMLAVTVVLKSYSVVSP